jgi:hypothetical protein
VFCCRLCNDATLLLGPDTAPAEAIEQLTEALARGRRLLARPSGARRADLHGSLQELSEAVGAALQALSDDENPSDENPRTADAE